MQREVPPRFPFSVLKYLHTLPHESIYCPNPSKRLVLLEDKRHTLNSLRVLIALDSFCVDKNICWPSHQKLGEITHLKAHKLSAAIKKLKDLGIVEKYGRNVFVIHYDKLPENGNPVLPESGNFLSSKLPESGNLEKPKLPENGNPVLPESGNLELPESGNLETPYPYRNIKGNIREKKKEKENPPKAPQGVFALSDFFSEDQKAKKPHSSSRHPPRKKRSNKILLNAQEQAIFDAAMSRYNKIAGTRRSECEPLKQRIREGRSLEDILQILENQRWKVHDEFHCKNFVPDTLFREVHWDKYLHPPQLAAKEEWWKNENFERRAI